MEKISLVDIGQIKVPKALLEIKKMLFGLADTVAKALVLAAGQISLDGLMLSEERKRLVEAARSLVFSKKFRGEGVGGGSLACAKVVATVLLKEGFLEKETYTVEATMHRLLQLGWKAKKRDPRPGDVVVWNSTPKVLKDGAVRGGRGHIGVVVEVRGDGVIMAVSNNSKSRMPLEHEGNTGYWARRGIRAFLEPPQQT